MDQINFAIALHFHQPVGNFDGIVDRAHQFSYQPFLKLLYNFPNIKMSFHISGCLLDYLEERHPQTLDMVREMVARGQIEMLGGGYYEPILPAIPERDIKGQIRMMSGYIKKRFGTAPNGMWIPERVWDPRLVRPIYDAGIRYAILDDAHLLHSGVRKEETFGFFLTGDGDKKIAVFPSDKMLRYKIPFELPEKIIAYFKEIAAKKANPLFTYGDDAEKFGEWPGTHKWVYEKGWLKNFFEVLTQNEEWIKLVNFSGYLKNNKPVASVDIKPYSYEEMMEWSDGSWMNFLSKYPQSNQMHKKMCYVSDKVREVEEESDGRLKGLDGAKRELYKGQCSCAYWHGGFGGIYLYHLRSAIYDHLIKAEKITDGLLNKKRKKSLRPITTM